MHRNRWTTLTAGVVLALAAALLVDHGAHLGADFVRFAVLGVAVGAVVGLVPDRAPAWRAGSFAGGLVACWLGYVLRAQFLPDIPLGRAFATAAVVGLVVIAAVATDGRLPLWAGLAGVGAFAGAYEATFAASPTTFLSDSVTAVSTTLVAAAIGFTICALFAEFPAPAGKRVITLPETAQQAAVTVPDSPAALGSDLFHTSGSEGEQR